MKKTISIFLLMCFSLSLMGMASAETGSNEATIKGGLHRAEETCRRGQQDRREQQ